MTGQEEGTFWRTRYSRPDPLRDPAAWKLWLHGESKVERSDWERTELHPIHFPMIDEAYSITKRTPAGEKDWFVVYTDPQCEKAVVEKLGEDLGFRAAAPIVKEWERRRRRDKDRRVKVERPLLPRYVFVELPRVGAPFGRVTGQKHVQEFLGATDPVRVPAGIVEELLERERLGDFDLTQPARKRREAVSIGLNEWIVPGAQVVVEDGPFASFPGVIEHADHKRGTAKVAVSIFGRQTPVRLEFEQFAAA